MVAFLKPVGLELEHRLQQKELNPPGKEKKNRNGVCRPFKLYQMSFPLQSEGLGRDWKDWVNLELPQNEGVEKKCHLICKDWKFWICEKIE